MCHLWYVLAINKQDEKHNMITKETAERIWAAYQEITTAKKLLEDMKPDQENFDIDEYAPTLKDAFGRRRHLELG